MIIGGNIRAPIGYPFDGTRVLTTAISLQTSQGDFAFAIALGIILLGIAVIVNIILNLVQSGPIGADTMAS